MDRVCCLCGEKFKEHGHNPYPLVDAKSSERCCDRCNIDVVIPARLHEYFDRVDDKNKGSK